MSLESDTNESLIRSSLIGLSVARTSDSVETAVAGYSDIDNRTPLKPTDQFLVYSITKTLIATLVMLLCQQGKLTLNAKLKEWFPEIPSAEKITIRQLLNHSSGLPDYGALPEYHQDVKQDPLHPWSEAKFLEISMKDGLLFEPGSGWSYSNIGYMLLVNSLESIAGKIFAELLSQQIFEPLGMEHSFVPATPEDLQKLAPGYSNYLADGKAEFVDVRHHYHPGWVSHRVVASTPSDIAKFLSALFAGNVVNGDSLNEMTTVTPVAHPHPRFRNPGYGLGLMSESGGELGRIFGHGGDGPGYSVSAFYRSGTAPVAVSAFCNTESSDAVEQLACDFLKGSTNG